MSICWYCPQLYECWCTCFWLSYDVGGRYGIGDKYCRRCQRWTLYMESVVKTFELVMQVAVDEDGRSGWWRYCWCHRYDLMQSMNIQKTIVSKADECRCTVVAISEAECLPEFHQKIFSGVMHPQIFNRIDSFHDVRCSGRRFSRFCVHWFTVFLR